MSDYLRNLSARSLGIAPVLRPRLASRFSPPAPAVRWPQGEIADRENVAHEEDIEEYTTPPNNGFEDAASQTSETRSTDLSVVPSVAPGAVAQNHGELSTEPRPGNGIKKSRRTILPMQWERPRFDPPPAAAAEAASGKVPSSLNSVSAGVEQIAPRPPSQRPGSSSTVKAQQSRFEAEGTLPTIRADDRLNNPLLSPRQPAFPHAEDIMLPSPYTRRRSVQNDHERQTGQAKQEKEPAIQVTIGSIEVRATMEGNRETTKPSTARPSMSLDEYIRRRSTRADHE
jgi:hypothetical protein